MSDVTNFGTSKKLVLIDGNSLLYRGFFAMRSLTTSSGQPTNAVFSFTMMLLTLLTEQQPDVIIAAWDTSTPTFRHVEFDQYKGQRSAPPPELKEQGPLAREMVVAFNIPMIEAPGFEADDIIGTLARRGRDQGYEVLIVTGDLDALQLVEPGVRVMTTVKGVTDTVYYDDDAVMNRYGLRPDQLADYRGLKGDTSDNIPGVPGVGEKTASDLLQQYGTTENLIEHIGEIKKAKLQASLEASREQIVLSKRLATIVRDVPLPGVDIPALDAAPHVPDWTAVRALFERLEFRALLKRIPSGSAASATRTAPSPQSSEESGPNPATPSVTVREDIDSPEYDPFAADTEETEFVIPMPQAAAIEDFRDVTTAADWEILNDAVAQAGRIGLRLHVNDGILDSRLLGVALATGQGTVFYVPLDLPADPMPAPDVQAATGDADDTAGVARTGLGGLFDEPALPAGTMPGEDDIKAVLPPDLIALLEDPMLFKITHEAKSDIAVLERYGVCLQGIEFDTEIASYLLNAGRRHGYPIDEIAMDYAGRTLNPIDRIDKKERKEMSADSELTHTKEQALKTADALLAVRDVQEPRLAQQQLLSVMNDFELPIAPILAEMELSGLAVDVGVLNRISEEMTTKMRAIETEVFGIAGHEFSISSTKQLQEVLFDELKLPATKKTKTGYSTGADVLEELAPEFPIVSLILQHREYSKLKGTYADAMPLLVRPDTGRIHTSLNQTVAATGRLSSSNPNLQNIPIRTAVGREIRRAFVAPPGMTLISADYSQIELRLFAHMAHDPELVAAFGSGEDIHKYTAGKVYGVPIEDVTSDMRRAAKTVNYAVIYGISEFALGRLLGIPMSAAKELKTSYFARFPGVRQFLDETVAFAREHGYVQTLFGRRRQIPDILSRVFQFRQAAERAAANMPIQGSSADIMKLAMISVYEMMRREKFKARLLLQVHDELLFEVPADEVGPLANRVHECMANAYPLDVALEVEVKSGATWADVTPVEDFDAISVDV